MEAMKIKLGCDPEVFLTDAAGALVSSIGKIGGSKQHPRQLPIGPGYFVQEDNVALEFNIPPAESKELFVNYIKNVKNYLGAYVTELGMKFSAESAAHFPVEQLQHPAAMEFGCDPDFNAWNGGQANLKPMADDWRLRSCGGHVHVGYKFATRREVLRFIKMMDLYLGVPSVLMDNGELRKQLYGAAGAFRFKPYGAEYRTLSNFWIFKDELIEWVWNATELAMDAWQNKKDKQIVSDDADNILLAVNGNSKETAQMLVNKYNLPVVYA